MKQELGASLVHQPLYEGRKIRLVVPAPTSHFAEGGWHARLSKHAAVANIKESGRGS